MAKSTAKVIAAEPRDIERIGVSVSWTEKYRYRLQALLETPPYTQQVHKLPPATRVFLLEDCWGGQSALGLPIGRNGADYGWYISVVGKNTIPSDNKFKLKLTGQPNDITLPPVEIGTSDYLSVVSQPEEWYAALLPINRLISGENTTIALGNPYKNVDLVNGDEWPLGVWYVNFDDTLFKDFATLSLEAIASAGDIVGLTQIHVERSFDLLDPTPVLVTDIDYRNIKFAWQCGTIVTCFDFMDIGYGIVRGTSRNLEIPTITL